MKTPHWKQEGNLYLWRYVPDNKNYSGWHLTADKIGVGSLLRLIQALKSDGMEQRRTLYLSAPGESEYRIPGCRSKPVPVSKLRVSFDLTGSSAPEILEQEGSIAIVFINPSNVDQYSKALIDLLNGNNDIQIGNHRSGIWRW
jgi:hypothetical protein